MTFWDSVTDPDKSGKWDLSHVMSEVTKFFF